MNADFAANLYNREPTDNSQAKRQCQNWLPFVVELSRFVLVEWKVVVKITQIGHPVVSADRTGRNGIHAVARWRQKGE